MKVLVVDDDPLAQKVMRVFLERSGYEPEIHSDAAKGLQVALSADAPSIVILDWMMPGLEGPAICEKIRGTRPRSDLM